ncbi:hypothetical protein NQ318_022943 [Aromia moschata]|uniref:Uncharacterized protein n=1 Tax=Aromia moschata TaxID=1265417 RepID=A0AAV8XH64_9CUCU|nr:hypothetical protein NQ318_022943 [Aromia moschata]
MNHYYCVPRCSSWIKKDPQLIFHIHHEQGKHQVSIINKFGQKERVDRRKAWILKLRIGKPVIKDLKKRKILKKLQYLQSCHEWACIQNMFTLLYTL